MGDKRLEGGNLYIGPDMDKLPSSVIYSRQCSSKRSLTSREQMDRQQEQESTRTRSKDIQLRHQLNLFIRTFVLYQSNRSSCYIDLFSSFFRWYQFLDASMDNIWNSKWPFNLIFIPTNLIHFFPDVTISFRKCFYSIFVIFSFEILKLFKLSF